MDRGRDFQTWPPNFSLVARDPQMLISAVIPVFNEAESLRELYGELIDVAREHGLMWDIVFVDDGSSDNSWAEIESLAAADPQVRGICLRRNFGKAAALSAGFQIARGEFVFTLDADLQDDPREIPKFLAEMEESAA
jgi:glycosyltransferase involved in cell wall biosynthesis